jgi:UPF0755 protein
VRLAAAAAGVGFFFGVFWLAIFLLQPVGGSDEPVTVDIPMGSTVRTIASTLKEEGVIRSSTAFVVMARILGETKNMKAGEYSIPPDLGVIEIIDRLVAGDAEAQWVSIPEGRTLRQIATALEGRRLARSGEFIRMSERQPQRFGLEIPVERRSVEGYLMPETYKFPKQISETNLIKHMLETWQKKVYDPHRELFDQNDLSVDEIVIIASMIEREARVPEDRPLISSVIRNRLKKNMLLQVDATVIYALGRHRDVVTHADLRVNHPYNTYRNKGLPPGPICNPGLDSILAALQPAHTEYVYYVAQPDGSHVFTRTYQEHQQAIRRIRQMRQEAEAQQAAAAEAS